MPRRFRLRVRPGHAIVTAAPDRDSESSTSAGAGAGEEVVVSEKTAAFFVRRRAVDIVEIISDPDESDQSAP
jgi:hypothetical protein